MRWTCDACRRALLLEETQELRPRVAARLQVHLASCPACRGYREEWMAMRESARRALVAEPDRTVQDRLLHRLATQPAGSSPGKPARLRLILTAAAAALMVAGLAFMFRRGPTDGVPCLHAVLTILRDDPVWTRAVLEAEQSRNREAQLKLFARHLLTLEGMAVEEVPEEDPNAGA